MPGWLSWRMIYEHALMFRLDTPIAKIDKALDDASTVVRQPLRNVERVKSRERIRDCGTHVMRVVRFEFDGDDDLMEDLREKLWADHDSIVSTLTIPHPSRERRTEPSKWPGALEQTFADTAFEKRPSPSRDDLLARYMRSEPKSRKIKSRL